MPFTTGLLIGIGETVEDRVDTLLAIRELHQRYGHIQEVIVQNFRAKPDIPMRDWPEPTRGEMLRTVAVARLLMPEVNIQAPPNLSAPYYDELLDAGINDWGGVSPLTPDFINPEKPWPHLEQLQSRTESRGYIFRQRLPVYPEFLTAITSRPGLLSEKVQAAADREGYAGRQRPHDCRAHRRHRRRQVCGRPAPDCARQKTSPSLSIPETIWSGGVFTFPRPRLHHLRPRRTCSARSAAGE